MKHQDSIFLKAKIRQLLKELAQELKAVEGDNIVSVSLTGSTVYGEMRYNQDVDLFIVLKKIKGEKIKRIINDLKRVKRGELDLEYKPRVPKVKKAFEKIMKKYTTKNTSVKYKFTLGNYWGKPQPNKKYTIHLHVMGPHSTASLLARINVLKVISSNAICNSRVIFGKNLEKLYKIKVLPKDVLSILKMLQARQNYARRIIKRNPQLALQISIKNLAKIAMSALELKNIFENRIKESGRLFKKHFNVPYNDLAEKAYQLKKNKEKILNSKNRVETIVQNTNELLKNIIRLLKNKSLN